MVDWKNIGVPIITAILVSILGGSAIINFVYSALFRPDVSIEVDVDNKENNHTAKVFLNNEGLATAKNLKFTLETPHNFVKPPLVFSTENFTKNFTKNSLELNIPRFVQGQGALVRMDLTIDNRSKISPEDAYNSYITYDQGSAKTVSYILPRPANIPDSAIEQLLDFYSRYGSGISFTLAAVSAAIVPYMMRKIRERQKAKFKEYS